MCLLSFQVKNSVLTQLTTSIIKLQEKRMKLYLQVGKGQIIELKFIWNWNKSSSLFQVLTLINLFKHNNTWNYESLHFNLYVFSNFHMKFEWRTCTNEHVLSSK